MTNRFPIILFFLLTLFSFAACKDDNITYAEELKAEREVIADFLSRQQYQVVTTLPADSLWPEKTFYKSNTGLYFRLTNRGDVLSGDTLVAGDLVVTRFLEYTLTEKADTVFNWTTIDFPYPTTFDYMDLAQVCNGWHEAAGYMKRNNAQATFIVPSKLGFPEFNRPATPMAYDMKIKIQKN